MLVNLDVRGKSNWMPIVRVKHCMNEDQGFMWLQGVSDMQGFTICFEQESLTVYCKTGQDN